MPTRPNIVLVTIDSLRTDYCGFMGNSQGLTPNVDRLADSGLVFENAISPGASTLDAMPNVFTGSNIPDIEGQSGISDSDHYEHHLRARETFAERLSELGYETGGFTANPWTSRYFGFDSGFDHFEDFLDASESSDGSEERERRFNSPVRYGLDLLGNWRDGSKMFNGWGSFYDDVVDWTQQASEPYFLWLFLVDVHMPYLPDEEFRSQSLFTTYAANLWLYLTSHGNAPFESVFRQRLLNAYEGTIRYTDHQLGRLVEDLSDDDPTFVIHADHGEEFGEHGIYGHGPNMSEETTRVPLVVANGPTGRVETPFSLSRLPDLLSGLATGEDVTELAEPVVCTSNKDPKFAARGRNWKYVERPDSEDLYEVGRGEIEPIHDEELRDLGKDVIARQRSTERERRRVIDAAEAVADAHTL